MNKKGRRLQRKTLKLGVAALFMASFCITDALSNIPSLTKGFGAPGDLVFTTSSGTAAVVSGVSWTYEQDTTCSFICKTKNATRSTPGITLQPNTTYHFSSSALNAGCSGGNCYNRSIRSIKFTVSSGAALAWASGVGGQGCYVLNNTASVTSSSLPSQLILPSPA